MGSNVSVIWGGVARRRWLWRHGATCVLALGWACGAQADLVEGKYGVAQVFDVQRSPAYPTAGGNFSVRNMNAPLEDAAPTPHKSYTIGAGQYIQLVRVGVQDHPCRFGINLYNADGSLDHVIAADGVVYGLAAEGFLHVGGSQDYGTFVANSAGYHVGDSATFVTPIRAATCAEATAYSASTTPLAASSALTAASVANIAATTADLVGTTSRNASGYWVVVPAGTPAPSPAEVRAGTAAGGAAAVAAGQGPMAAGMPITFSMVGLTSATNYVAYLVADDGTGVSAPLGQAFTTLAAAVVATPTGVPTLSGWALGLLSGLLGWRGLRARSRRQE